MSTAQRLRSPIQSKKLKLPAIGPHTGHISRHVYVNDKEPRYAFQWSIPRTRHLGIRNLPRKQRVTIKLETMAIRLLNNEYTSPKRIKRLTSRLSKQICLINRAA